MEAIKTEKTNEVQVDIVGVTLCLLQRGVGEEWLSTHTHLLVMGYCVLTQSLALGVYHLLPHFPHPKMRTVTLYPQYMLSQHSINVSDEIM